VGARVSASPDQHGGEQDGVEQDGVEQDGVEQDGVEQDGVEGATRAGQAETEAGADAAPEAEAAPTGGDLIAFSTAVRAWFMISLQTFGGPAGQIAVMQRTLVEEKRWIGQRRFSHALNYCMLLPGPEAQQLAIYIGWLLNGVRGGLAAGVLFVLPGAVALLGLSVVYVAAGKRSLHHPALVALAVAAFAALSVFAVPFPTVIAAAGMAGWLLGAGRSSTARPG